MQGYRTKILVRVLTLAKINYIINKWIILIPKLQNKAVRRVMRPLVIMSHLSIPSLCSKSPRDSPRNLRRR